jgi:hypothetical protein
MDAQSVDLVKRTAQASIMYAALAGVAMIVLNLLSKVPFIGFAFGCLSLFAGLGIAFGIGYLIAPKMANLPIGQSKAMVALWIALGVALPLTVAFTIASVVGTMWDVISIGYTLLGTIFRLITAIVVGLFSGLLIGTALAWLGSFFALDRNPNMQSVSRPF